MSVTAIMLGSHITDPLSSCMSVSASEHSPKNKDESAFIERLLQGDEQAFCELIRLHHSRMLNLARRIVGDSFAEDIVQEAWESIYSALSRFEHRSSLKTWILTIVVNGARARLKKEARLQSLDEMDGEIPGSYLDQSQFHGDGHWRSPPPQWGSESPQALLEARELQECIARALEQLPTLQKTVLLLRDIEQESFDSLCNMLDISHSNARVLLHRARLSVMQSIDRFQETGQC